VVEPSAYIYVGKDKFESESPSRRRGAESSLTLPVSFA
jgi:hypothetical protein